MSLNKFDKENIDKILYELAKEYRRIIGRNVPAEIILIGGAAVIENYSFRESTTDIDAEIFASSALKQAINNVGDRFELPNGWLNDDFKRTESYSNKIIEVSKYYKTFCSVLSVRTIKAEYLVAMKLKSSRKYKNDLSDIVGIIREHEETNNPLTKEMIENAIEKLYGNKENLPLHGLQYLNSLFNDESVKREYSEIRQMENDTKSSLISFEKKYPNVLNTDNVDDIITKLNKKKKYKDEMS